jgi:class 3 adenylate cyclase/tetratricopeptide (TPR) repeat protein
VKTCPSCGRENADDARFCSQCATPLTSEAPTREERKVVTCLFCDLVGFTTRAESMDPEDVRRLLQPYHANVRAELERFGGTVEKFIGDAVMAVFGAPVAHEDDPERAVRAALAIRDLLVEEGELEVRIGITTGEALVALDARPEAGEGMASGDVVNTAARLESAAPTNGILVDETTYRATERSIEYEGAAAIEAKGKAEPVAVWEARRARARVSVERVGGAALVGREQELTLLRETLARVVREREPQLVTLVGVPGIGKSRLVFELFQMIEEGPFGLVYWRHGRSPPYGDGVTFWALGEMIKAQAGILESDSADHTEAKLRQAVERFVDDPADVAWLERHLRPLTGLDTDEPSRDRREESFAAWRRYLEAIADERPLVLIFEDLHWADDALLDFVDYLVDWASGVPILALSTARPELLARRPGWGGGKVNSSTIQLSPLTEEETARLLHALLGRSALDADLQTRLLEHAGGNPLYAEEFTRMLSERPSALVLPETVQGLIAARLDTLPAEEKELLQAAAVIGRAFWLGALSGERWTLEDRLHALSRKEFVTRQRRSSVAGEEEYAFRHALVREVAYEQIPRAQRADKHRAAAQWIESLGRLEDHAEMLAHHYLLAIELSQAAGEQTDDLADAARPVLEEAGDRASALNSFAAALRFYDRAVALTPSAGARWSSLLFRRARAGYLADTKRSEALLEEARDALLAAGDAERAAETEALLAEHWWLRGDRSRSRAHLDRAHELVAQLEPSPGKAQVLSQVARYRALGDDDEEAIAIGREALAMAESLGLDAIRANALANVALAKFHLGDLAGGLQDQERSVELSLAARSPDASRGYNNLGVFTWQLGEFRRAFSLIQEAVVVGERLGHVSMATYAGHMLTFQLFELGEWDEGFPRADAFLAACDAGETHYLEAGVRRMRAEARLARDDAAGVLAELPKIRDAAKRAGDPQALVPALATAARIALECGRVDDAKAYVRDVLAVPTRGFWYITLAATAYELGYAAELEGRIGDPMSTTWTDAARADLRGDFASAAALYGDIGVRFTEALARMRAARQFAAEGRHAETAEQLEQALAFWRPVGATRYIRQAEGLLSGASEIPA